MAAKQQVSLHEVAIDMPAGPSEVCVIADKESNPVFVAADLLSQAEHGIDSQVFLITDSELMLNEVKKQVTIQLERLPRKEIAAKSLDNSKLVLVHDLDEAMELSNAYAPEHLILATTNSDTLAAKVINAGSVFLGKWACESAGDYASGKPHTSHPSICFGVQRGESRQLHAQDYIPAPHQGGYRQHWQSRRLHGRKRATRSSRQCNEAENAMSRVKSEKNLN